MTTMAPLKFKSHVMLTMLVMSTCPLFSDGASLYDNINIPTFTRVTATLRHSACQKKKNPVMFVFVPFG